MAKGKSTWKYNKLLTARRNYFAGGGVNWGLKKDDPNVATSGFAGALNSGSLGGAATAVGGMIGSAIGGGLESGAGNVIGGLADVASQLPGPWGAVAGAGLKIIGGGVNALLGSKLNEKNIAAVNQSISAANNVTANAASFDDLVNTMGSTADIANFSDSYIGKDGVFSNKAKKKAAELRALRDVANARQDLTMTTNAENITEDTMSDLLANYAALGGPLMFSKGGSIYIKPENRGKFTEYCGGEVTSECIARGKRSSSPAVRKRATFAANARKWKHAFGGDLLTHGANFDTGVTLIGNGGTHEENPFEGVLMGVDQEGIPNLVEEGEVIFNDYVFSNRLKVPKEMRKKYKLGDNKALTFAKAATKMSKESEERPNDPISQRGLQALMSDLANAQEEIRAKDQEGMFAYGGKVNKFSPGGEMVSNYRQAETDYPYDQTDAWAELMGRQLRKRLESLVAMPEGKEKQAAIDAFVKEANDIQDSYYKNIYNSGVKWGGKALKGAGQSHQELWNNAGYNNYEQDTFDEWYSPRGMSGDVKGKWVDNIIGDLTLNRHLGDERFIRGKNHKILSDLASQLGLSWGSRDNNVDGNTLMYFDRVNKPTQTLESTASPGLDLTTEDLSKAKILDTKLPSSVRYPGTRPDEESTVKKFPTWMRYTPAVASGIMSITDALGLTNKPDYSEADMVLDAVRNSGSYQPVGFNPIGNYLTYTPFDREFYINQLNAQSGATRRAIMQNAGLNRGAGMAALLASDYNAQGQLGQLARQAEEYNLAQRQKVEEFNRGTNITNSQGFLQADIANQKALAESRNYALKGTLAAAQMRAAERQKTESNKSLNLSNFLQSIGDIGWENEQKNWRNAMYLAGAFGGKANDDSEYLMGLRRKGSKGGKLKKKKGLTL